MLFYLLLLSIKRLKIESLKNYNTNNLLKTSQFYSLLLGNKLNLKKNHLRFRMQLILYLATLFFHLSVLKNFLYKILLDLPKFFKKINSIKIFPFRSLYTIYFDFLDAYDNLLKGKL